MSDYNLIEANIWFISAAAFLARDMGLDVQRKPLGIKAQRALERRIDNWRESTMKIVQQHQQAHKRIRKLEGENEAMAKHIRKYSLSQEPEAWPTS